MSAEDDLKKAIRTADGAVVGLEDPVYYWVDGEIMTQTWAGWFKHLHGVVSQVCWSTEEAAKAHPEPAPETEANEVMLEKNRDDIRRLLDLWNAHRDHHPEFGRRMMPQSFPQE